MKTAKKQQFIKRCNDLGVTFADNGFCLAIDTPKNKVFASFATHSEAMYFTDGWKMGEIYAELIYIMKDGLDDCNDEECEICTDHPQLHSTINNYQY
jgi:chromosome condensin MukBEF complex kleisin-like MukF subunit